MEDVMNVVFLGLGGNEGQRSDILKLAIKAIEQECGRVVKRSQVYETEAWGVSTENKFLNQVIQLETHLKAEDLLEKVLTIEKKLGRIRNTERYSDRKIDIDVLFYNSEEISIKDLEIPHPRLHLRKFVLIPLHEIAPFFVHPGLKKSITELLRDCEDSLEVRVFKL